MGDQDPGVSRLGVADEAYRVLLELAPDAIVFVDGEGRVVLVNAQAEELFGYAREELIGQPVEVLLPGQLAAAHQAHRTAYVADPRVRQMGAGLELAGQRKDGSQFPVDVSLSPVETASGKFVTAAIRDISDRKQAEEERRRLQEQLFQAQKLEAVGRLAGGIAHDFNNMLTAIKGYSGLLLDELEPGTRAHDEASQIQRATEQASTLPAQLLAFSRSQPLELQLIDLHNVITSASVLLQHLLSEAIGLVVLPSPESAFVLVDAARIETALVNLALNARDAMPNGGTLIVGTERVEIREDGAAEHQVAAGPYVVLSVTDDGDGMNAETAARAFEPFFTTKPDGRGSGLGLASVYGTVSQSGGFVTLGSRPGHGTVVHVYLPAAEAPADANLGPEEKPVPVEESALAGEECERPVVLLAEDEEIVREFVTHILEREGYTVHAAANGADALELLGQLDRPVDVLLTDMVMPGMGGVELADRVAGHRAETVVLFMSGYTEEPPVVETADKTPSGFLKKPFSPTALRQAVNRASGKAENTYMTATSRLTCVIVDDHPAILDAVSQYLQSAGLNVVAHLLRADDALQAIQAQRPDLAVIDIGIEPFNGLELARQARLSTPQTKIVLYTGSRDPELLRQALTIGVRGFAVKEAPLSELVQALIAVANGDLHIDPELADALGSTVATTAEPRPLTSREQEILALISAGNTNDKVAAELGISPETVQSHVRNTMNKLGADTRSQAIAIALRHSLID